MIQTVSNYGNTVLKLCFSNCLEIIIALKNILWKIIPTTNISQKYYLAICPVTNNEKKPEVPQFKKSWQPIPNPCFTLPPKEENE